MKIREADLTDAKGISLVQVESWRNTYRGIVPDEYLRQMTWESREPIWKEIISTQLVFVAESSSGEIVGFSNGGKERSGSYPGYQGELYAIYVSERERGKGLGKLLLKPLIRELKKEHLFSLLVLVLEENPYRPFYESLGASRIDVVELDLSGKKLKEIVYGWKDIRTIIQSR